MQNTDVITRWARAGRAQIALSLVLAAGFAAQAADVLTSGVLKREFFAGATRAGVEDGSVTTPTTIGVLTSFDAPTGVADNYTQRISGFFIPPSNGKYIFFVSADDDADLFVSTDENPANKVLVASEVQWSNQRQWLNTGDGTDNAGDPGTKRSDNSVGAIQMTANKRYYIEGVQHEGGGGDNFAATFKLDTQDDPANGSASAFTGKVIAASLPAGTVTITTQPVAVTTIEGVTATFSVVVTSTGVVAPAYQWSKNGAEISGASAASYTTPILALGDSGAKYSVKIVVPGADVSSSEVVLTVAGDTIAPAIVSAGGIRKGAGVEVGVIFDEAIDAASVVAGNFSLSSGTVTAARHLPNSSGNKSLQSGVVLTATGLAAGASGTVTVKNVADKKGNKIGTASAPFKVSNMTWAALGNEDPAFPAAAIAVGDDGFNVNSGGNAFWNTTDDVTFVYEEITGNFDKVAQVEYQDASSQWARAGLHARESLGSLAEEASRFQNSHVNPSAKTDGGASNNSWETNRRLNKGGATTSSSGGGALSYPNGWVRLARTGDVIRMGRSYDGVTWYWFDPTNFNPADGSNADGPLTAKMFVGLVFGPENGNLDAALRQLWTARFRKYGDINPNKAHGAQTYAIGINFDDDDVSAWVGPKEIAGVASVAQSNWNSLPATGSSAEAVALSADVNSAPQTTTAKVEWVSNNTWASTGRGEENNGFSGSDWQLLKGYLDTGNATTSKVTLTGIPSQLTGATGGYDVVVYALGGVPDRGGGFRITDASGTELKAPVLVIGPAMPKDFVEAKPGADPAVHAAGTYVVFRGLKAASIVVEGSTENGWGIGGAPRAPINAIQLVPNGAVDAVVSKPTIAIARDAAGAKITFTGTLQKATSVTGPFADVMGATSPAVVSGGAAAFYRTR